MKINRSLKQSRREWKQWRRKPRSSRSYSQRSRARWAWAMVRKYSLHVFRKLIQLVQHRWDLQTSQLWKKKSTLIIGQFTSDRYSFFLFLDLSKISGRLRLNSRRARAALPRLWGSQSRHYHLRQILWPAERLCLHWIHRKGVRRCCHSSRRLHVPRSTD